jgi:hypothetical protein
VTPTEMIAAFRAALDADEATARAVTERQPYDEWDAVGAGTESDVHRSHWEVVRIARPHPNPAAHDIAQHIARHDPAFVLADIASKRKLLDTFERRYQASKPGIGEGMHWVALQEVVRTLAEAYGIGEEGSQA